MPVRKIISGGQTGVDRGALDAAIELGLLHGGWCPLGRLAEDGFIPARYALRQTEVPQYSVRTERNLLEADGTLILYRRELTGGTDLTDSLCRRYRRPVFRVNLERSIDLAALRRWLDEAKIETLNVAGPRESTAPGIAAEARALLLELLRPESEPPGESSEERRGVVTPPVSRP
jgi:hypothetical protein